MWKIIKLFPDPDNMLKKWQILPEQGLVLSRQQSLRSIGVDTFKDGRIYITYVDDNNKKHLLKRSHIIYYFAKKEMPLWNVMVIDHADKNPNNDRIENLRPLTLTENADNCKKQNGTSSKYKGVNWDKSTSMWMSKLRHNGKTHHCGRYYDEVQAAKEYDMTYWRVKRSTLGMNFPELLNEYLQKMNTERINA